MQSLMNKNIIVGVTGGIAAYKSAYLVRALKQVGANVQVVMTSSAREFVTELTFQALSGREVQTGLLSTEAENAMGHIKLARWADAILIAPATANFMARFVSGKADDLLSAVCLASEAILAIAPAMNSKMWQDKKTQRNLAQIIKDGVLVFGPDDGSQACGEMGLGRMLEPNELAIQLGLSFNTEVLSGKKILITAGPTREAIDPVRFISNKSSGKMGYALAAVAIEMGAKVELISGPSCLIAQDKIILTKVETAAEMLEAVMQKVDDCDWVIGAAAVADYAPVKKSAQKIKKQETEFTLTMRRNPDILATLGKLKPKPFLIGFAAETENLAANAKSKLAKKSLDVIVANQVGEGLGFEVEDNEVTLFWSGGKKSLIKMRKTVIARKILEICQNLEHSGL